MPRPPVAAARELILPVFTQWEKVGSVTEILSELTVGWFYNAALLVDQAWRDDRVRSAYSLRLQTALSLPAHMEPPNSTKKAQAIADEAMELWPTMAPLEELCELMLWGDHLGVGIARQNWIDERGVLAAEDDPAGEDDVAGAWIPTLRAWHGGALRYDLMSDRYMLRTYDQGEIPIAPEDRNWVLYTPFGFKYGRLRGLLVSLAMLWLDRQWTFRDRARHGEVYGQPIRQGISPLDADQRDKDRFRQMLGAQGTELAIVTPQGEREKWDIKLVEAQANAHQVFSTHLDHADRAISTLYNGQSESMQGRPGLGSQDKAGDQVMRYVLRFVAKCVGTIAGKLLGDWAEYNHGDRRLAPKFVIEVDPPEDGAEKADELNTLGDAIAKLEKYGLDARKLLEEAGAPMLTAAELAAKLKEIADREAAARESQPPAPTDGKEPPK